MTKGSLGNKDTAEEKPKKYLGLTGKAWKRIGLGAAGVAYGAYAWKNAERWEDEERQARQNYLGMLGDLALYNQYMAQGFPVETQAPQQRRPRMRTTRSMPGGISKRVRRG